MSLQAVKQAHSKLRRASADKEQARLELVRAIREARESHTLEELGAVLGVSRQRIYQLLRDN